MLDITKVLNRSWHILWKYRILWVFGFFLAMSAGGGGGPNAQWNMGRRDIDRMPWDTGGGPGMFGLNSHDTMNMWIIVGIVLLVVILIWAVISTFLKYISETATIQAVNDYEDTGIKAGFKQLWKTGWSKTSWHLFLINLLLSLPMLVMVLLLGLLGLWVYFAVEGGSEGFMIFSIVTAVGLALLFILFFILLGIALGVIGRFALRICVLEGTGVIDSIKQAYAMIRRHLKQVFFMWLVMIGIGIAWAIASLILIIPLLLVVMVTLIPGILAGGIPGLIATGFAALFQMPPPWYWFVGAAVALPLFFLVAFSPMLLVSGWQQIFNSSVWTETYRELKALETIKPEAARPLDKPKPSPRKVVKAVSAKPVTRSKTTPK
ncbi:MAG: hypothetical protein JW704_06635 [Anaerolineaceae bacterium]|nr:hypothetical protein [Anaerolineaceae bacterium]MBN2677986.1 hypothetical protein [Anaerolineaceae bacterium]